MRFFTAFAVAALGIAGCGYDPHPKDGKLPCTEGCPSGYECRCDKRCWSKGTAGGTCSDAAQDTQGRDSRATAPDATLDGSAAVDVSDVSLDGTNDVPMDMADARGEAGPDGKTDALSDVPLTVDGGPEVTADAGTDADAPLPSTTICVADQSKFDECTFGP